jgi:hypothetical protein
MTVVSSKEFSTNQKKYFDLAIDEEVVIKSGDNMFHLMYKPVEMAYPEQPILEPDDNLRRAITMDELKTSALEHISQLFASR